MDRRLFQNSVPLFLTGIIASYPFSNRAGEWDLIHPEPVASGSYVVPMQQATTLLRQFLQAADFATFRHVTVHVDGGLETCVWAQGNARLDEFFAQVESSGQQCGGIEAILDLTLQWIAPDGIMGSVTLPKAGLLWLTIDSHFRLRSTLTVWPNVFTDETYLYALNQRGTFDSWLVDFVPAAGSNRAQMRRMLQAWEARTGGHVMEWESELVEGVERYGFADDATVIEEL